MKLMEKLFALRQSKYLKGLDESALTLIAEIAETRVFAPGEKFADAGHCLQRLYLVVEGAIQNQNDVTMPEVLGPASLLFGVPVHESLIAVPGQGATCLVVGKGHFFTIVYQFPSLLCRLLETNRFEVEVVQSDG